MAAEKLRDLSQPLDVGLLDATVAAFYGTGSKDERSAADHILRDLQNNPDMWLQVVHILSSTQNLNTKFFALQVLEGVIKYRWNALPVEQRDGMKNYISDVIVKLSSDEVSFRTERLYVNKLNIILVQILKHEWPSRWRSFIPDLVAAAKSSETICENCMVILKLLSEEVFDFSRGEMTQLKIKELKQSLNSEFQLIHELCLYVLPASQRAELIRATLDKARDENSGEEGEEEIAEDSAVPTMPEAETNGDHEAESEENTYEDDEIDDQEDMLWEDDEELIEHENEERVLDEFEVSEEEATDEDDEVSGEEAIEEDEVSEEEATKEENYEDNDQGEKGIAKQDTREAKAKEDRREAKEHGTEKPEANLKNINKSNERRNKKVQAGRLKIVDSEGKPESSRKRKVKKRVDSMGMVFMCSSETKKDCYQYRVLGLPESKKDIVEKIYTGMRLFLYDIDLKLMYGIYKAAAPGGYNIEPKAFKSQFPSQVRFKVLESCVPLAEEKFKTVIKENYFTRTKFDCQLNSEQVKKLCRLFALSSKGRPSKKLSISHKGDKHKQPIRPERNRRQRTGDKRRLPLREEVKHHERPRKRLRKVMSPPPPRQRPAAQLPSTVPSSYAYSRASDADVYRRDLYLEPRSPYRDRRDRPLTPIERYKDGRDPRLERRYAYRGGRDSHVGRRDPFADDVDSYSRRRDLL